MAYIGRTPLSGDFRKIDSIESQFDSIANTFPITFQTEPVVPGSPFVMLAVLDGQVLEPETDYNVNGTNFIFTNAPNAAQTFHAIILGNVGSSYVYTGNVGGGGGGITSLDNLTGNNVTINNITVTSGSVNNTTQSNTNVSSGVINNTTQSNTTISSGSVSNATLSNVQFAVYKESIIDLGSISGSTNVNLSLGNIFRANLTGNTTLTFTNHPSAPLTMPITIIATQVAGNSTITVNNAVYTESALPQLSTASGNSDVLTFFSPNGGQKYIGTHAIADVII